MNVEQYARFVQYRRLVNLRNQAIRLGATRMAAHLNLRITQGFW